MAHPHGEWPSTATPQPLSPVDDQGQWPLDHVVEGKGLQTTQRELRGVSLHHGLLLLGLDGQDSQELSDEVMRHEVNLRKRGRKRCDLTQPTTEAQEPTAQPPTETSRTQTQELLPTETRRSSKELRQILPRSPRFILHQVAGLHPDVTNWNRNKTAYKSLGLLVPKDNRQRNMQPSGGRRGGGNKGEGRGKEREREKGRESKKRVEEGEGLGDGARV